MKNITRREYHNTGAKIMRKVKGRGWVTIAASALALSTFMPTLPVSAATQAEIENILTAPKSTTFSDKERMLSLSLTQAEISDALDNVKPTWEQNSLDQVKAEIERQQELGLEVYVFQWGDTLSVLAEATNRDLGALAKANGITDKDFILAGDILTLERQDLTQSVTQPVLSDSSTPDSNKPEPNKPTPEEPTPEKPTPEEPKPEEPKPEEPKPEEPKPEEPTPEEPKPEEPKPEEPKPEEPKPEELKPEEPKPEEPKPEEPKPEEPKPEEPKPEDPQPEDPQPEDPQPEGPQPEEPKPEEPKPEEPKPEEPQPEEPKPEEPKPEDPQPEDPQPEDPQPEDPQPEGPQPEEPKPEEPKPEEPKPEEPQPEESQPEEPTPEEPQPEEPKPEEPKPEKPGESGEEVVDEVGEGETTDEVISEVEVPGEGGATGEERIPGETVYTTGETGSETSTTQDEPTYEYHDTEVQATDEEGNLLFDEEGTPVMTVVTEEIEIPGATYERTVTTTTDIATTSPDTVIVYDNTLAEGTEIVDQEGSAGVTHTYTITTTIDGEVVDTATSTEVIQGASDRIVRKGTQVKGNTKRTIQSTTVLTGGTKVVNDPSLWEDFTETVEGKDGYIRTTIEVLVDAEGNELSREVVNEERVDATNTITTVGTKPINASHTAKITAVIAFVTERRDVDSYDTKETVIQTGQVGSKDIVYTVHTVRGKEVSREIASESVTKNSVKQIIEVGKGNLSQKEESKDLPVAFETETRENKELDEGTRNTVQEGENGVKTTVYLVSYKDGKEVSREILSSEVTTKPVKEIIEVGTKPKENREIKEEENVVTLRFTTERRATKDLFEGETRVVTKGVDGEITITKENTYVDGKLVDSKEVSRETTKQAVKEIVEFGTKQQVDAEYDLEAVRVEFHNLVNQLRVSKGLNELEYYSQFQGGADLRAYEVREDGGTFGHIRPDGSSHATALLDEIEKDPHNYAIGENILYRGWMDGETAEEVAGQMYNQFKDSPGHYNNILRANYTGQTYGLYLSPRIADSYPYRFISAAQMLAIKYSPNN